MPIKPILYFSWCTGVDEPQNPKADPTNFHTWLALLRYAFSATGQRTFCTSPVLAVDRSATDKVSVYSRHGEPVGERDKVKQPPCLTLPFPQPPGYGYANRVVSLTRKNSILLKNRRVNLLVNISDTLSNAYRFTQSSVTLPSI